MPIYHDLRIPQYNMQSRQLWLAPPSIWELQVLTNQLGYHSKEAKAKEMI